MNAQVEPMQFFAPVSMDLIDQLVAEHAAAKSHMQKLSTLLQDPPYRGVIGYFVEAAQVDSHRHALKNADNLFALEKALKVLDADFWRRTLDLTDVLDCMPAKRRAEWFELVRNLDTPPYEEQTVRATLMDLLAQRASFFAERVDGIFQALSREHVTNCPEGFRKRMILYYAYCAYSINHDQAGYINDLRAVIARLSGREEPKWFNTNRLLDRLKKHTGKWFDVDGGALRIRVYKKGTAHLEVHPDVAWRLNQILAYLHPAAIPSHFRAAPKKQPKHVKVMQRPLPFAVTEILADMHQTRGVHYTYVIPHPTNAQAGARDQAIHVLESLGGIIANNGLTVQFDYRFESVLNEVVISGCVPDTISHQYYPTPESLAQRVVDLAQIGLSHSCLEPQAGQGGLAKYMPMDRTTCVEISPLHCEILRSKGYDVVEKDFLSWEGSPAGFDRIVMNPPFNLNRWSDHLQAAANKVKPGGRLVAILPSGAKNKPRLKGWHCTWHGPYENEFPGASVAVVILVADRPPI